MLDMNDWKRRLDGLARKAGDLNTQQGRDNMWRELIVDARDVRVATLRDVLRGLGCATPPQARYDCLTTLVGLWAILPAADRAHVEASRDLRREQARHVENLAHALKTGAFLGSEYAMVTRLREAVELLAAWTPDDRG